MYMRYYLDEKGNRVYTMKVKFGEFKKFLIKYYNSIPTIKENSLFLLTLRDSHPTINFLMRESSASKDLEFI
jgi:hypothetical protein